MTNPPIPSHDRRMLALGIRLVAISLLGMMLVFVKLASESGVALPEIMFWRQAMAVPVVIAWVLVGNGLPSLKTARFKDHARRAGLGLTGMVFTFGSAILLPLAESTTIGFTVPIFATILSIIILKEQVGWHRWAAVLMGFAGVIVVVQPGNSPFPMTGVAVGLTAAFMIAIISLQIRDLGRTENPATTVFWFSLLSCIPLGFVLPFVFTPHTATQWMFLIAAGICGGVGQIALTASLKYAPVSTVVGMDYIGLVWATLFGWLIWDHMPPNSTWFGAPLIIASSAWIAWREHRLSIHRVKDIPA